MVSLPDVSVCMIARDEEETIGRAVESVSRIANEIIVVDTGSQDATAKIAAKAGARVIDHEWRRDFSEARNFAMGCATNDWVFQLDADEELYEPLPAQISRLISDHEVQGYFCQLVNLALPDTQRGAINSKAMRLFRRDYYYYKGIVHEVPARKQDVHHHPSKWAGLRILHSGYMGSELTDRKVRRNIELLGVALMKDPGNYRHHYYLGRELMVLKTYEKAIEELKLALSLRPSGAGAQHAYLLLGLCECLGHAGRVNEAVDHGEIAAAEFPDYRDIIFVTAELHVLAGNRSKALVYFEQCSKMPTVPSRYLRARQGLDKLARKRISELRHGRS